MKIRAKFDLKVAHTLRNKGSKKVLVEGMKFYPKPFASEEPIFEENFHEGFLRLRVPLRTIFGSKSSSRIIESFKYSSKNP